MTARAVLRAAVLAGATALAAAAGAPAAIGFQGQTVADSPVALHLRDVNGAMRSLDEFRGRVVLVFFGFANCPDVCPTELARLAEVMRLLGEAATQVQVLFVTIDPARDTPALLRAYVAAFSPDFMALRGDDAATADAAAAFRVFFRRVEGSAPGRYTIEHSAYVHALDPAGRLRLRLPGSLPPAQIADDVRALLAGR